jgi:hypothetical protein
MLGETIGVDNYFDTLKILHEKNDEYDILIDYHDKKKWIISDHITLTLIRPEDNPYVYKHMGTRRGRERYGRYILNKDGSVAYIYDIRCRYDYFPRKYIEGGINNGEPSVTLKRFYASRNDSIDMYNRNKEVLVDNGKNKEDYMSPYIDIFNKNERKFMMPKTPLQKNNRNTVQSKKGRKPYFYTFILRDRNDGGIDLYDTWGILHYICNIGKRYEYYRTGRFDKSLSTVEWWKSDTIIEFIPDETDKWITATINIDPDNNPYLVKPRADGGVDLISKEDNTLKYICNIGKRFYYVPSDEMKKLYGKS